MKTIINSMFVLSLSCLFGMSIYIAMSTQQEMIINNHEKELMAYKIETATNDKAHKLMALNKTSYDYQIKINNLTPEYSLEYKQELINKMLDTETNIRQLESESINKKVKL